MEDWQSGELVLVPLAEMDLEEKTIMHLYTDEVSGEDCWYKAWVAGIDDESEDMVAISPGCHSKIIPNCAQIRVLRYCDIPGCIFSITFPSLSNHRNGNNQQA